MIHDAYIMLHQFFSDFLTHCFQYRCSYDAFLLLGGFESQPCAGAILSCSHRWGIPKRVACVHGCRWVLARGSSDFRGMADGIVATRLWREKCGSCGFGEFTLKEIKQHGKKTGKQALCFYIESHMSQNGFWKITRCNWVQLGVFCTGYDDFPSM